MTVKWGKLNRSINHVVFAQVKGLMWMESVFIPHHLNPDVQVVKHFVKYVKMKSERPLYGPHLCAASQLVFDI